MDQCGPPDRSSNTRGAAAGTVELKRRATGERVEVTPEEALAKIG